MICYKGINVFINKKAVPKLTETAFGINSNKFYLPVTPFAFAV
jgi:hypothetical protein